MDGETSARDDFARKKSYGNARRMSENFVRFMTQNNLLRRFFV